MIHDFSHLKNLPDYQEFANFLPNTLNEIGFRNTVSFLCGCYDSVIAFYREQFPLLYLSYDKVKEKKDYYLTMYFEKQILFSIIYYQLYPQLEEIFLKENLDPDQMKYLDSGSSNFSFAFQDKVFKFGLQRMTFDFPIFYRINDLLIQKRFLRENGTFLYWEVSPLGKKVPLTEEDILAIQEDFSKAGICLTDPNFQQNFALFENEFREDCYLDIEGKHERIELPKSNAYQKRKLKLIDLDYLYNKEDKNKVYAPKL